ncbi:helix-turn-helix domain-containing protein, partial [Paenibacillus hemerocallicola]|uniref:helix-turn-helix domain-containing protein n=1 Tax=Paenibacillus hemerocallicola TaxID=1172614 RepID=UPI00159ECF08
EIIGVPNQFSKMRAISERVLQAMQPAQLELALQVMDKLVNKEDHADKGWKLLLERTTYEADRAERQYQQVEPENRLVARSLEAKWNEKLLELERVQTEYAQYRARLSWRPSDEDRAEILELANTLPRIWSAATTVSKDRKRIIRLLIGDVTVFAEARNPEVRLGLRWRNHCSEELVAKKPLPKGMERKHTTETADLVRELAVTLTDDQIAMVFNEQGRRTPEGRAFTTASIRWLRYLHKIPAYFVPRRGLTVKEVAEKLAVSAHVVYYWIERSMLKAHKQGPGHPWDILLDDEQEAALRQRVLESGHHNHGKKQEHV